MTDDQITEEIHQIFLEEIAREIDPEALKKYMIEREEMTKKQRKKKIKADRLWRHFMYWCDFKNNPPFINLVEVQDYDPEKWRNAFERFQERGAKSLTTEELQNIKPILDGQRQKEIFLNGIIEEGMEFWSTGHGWWYPLYASFKDCDDRLTKVAIGKIIRNLYGYGKKEYDPMASVDFFLRTPCISDRIKSKLFATKYENS
jgi:hypothetical protein